MLRRGKEHNVSRCLLKIESIIVIKGDLSSPVTMFNLHLDQGRLCSNLPFTV